MWWHDYEGEKVGYSVIGPGEDVKQWTYVTHPWSATAVYDSSIELTVDGDDVFVPEISDNTRTIVISQPNPTVDPTTVPTVTGTTGTIFLDGNWVETDAVTVYQGITSPQ